MDDRLYFSEQHEAVRDMVRAFAREQVAPVAAKHDEDSTFPWENVKRMGELGLLGVPWPEEIGGAGFDTLSFMIAIEELGKVDASHSITISAHTTLGTSPIVNFGTKAQIERYVPPRGGMNQMNQLLHASFDRFPRLVESRYDEAFVYLNARCRKRSLVILLTNVIDEVNSHQVSRYLTSLVGRHLPLGVLLRDHAIFDAAAATAVDPATVYRAAAAHEIVTWRRGVLADMESQGVRSLDVFPEQMTAPLVNSYLEIKARHLL